jgi:transposase
LREIARRTGFSRNTIRRYLRNETVEPIYSQRQTSHKLDPYADKLSKWLEHNACASRKQRRTAKQMHADLCALSFDGSYDRVVKFAQKRRQEQQELCFEGCNQWLKMQAEIGCFI